jgi:hypothetical protein
VLSLIGFNIKQIWELFLAWALARSDDRPGEEELPNLFDVKTYQA